MQTATVEAFESTLAARSYLYDLFWMILADNPRIEVVEALTSDLAAEAMGLVGAAREAKQAFAGMARTLRVDDGDVDTLMDELQSQYTRLFLMPGKTSAQPWESMHTGDRSGLFQDCTIEVRRDYAKYGLQSTRIQAEPDDHVAIELRFMSMLSTKAINSFAENDASGLTNILADSADFLDKHLLAWVDGLAHTVASKPNSSEYAVIVTCLAYFVKCDREFLATQLTKKAPPMA